MYDKFIWGGYRSYGTLTERNDAAWRIEGMMCYVAETGRTYRLMPDLITWVDPFVGSVTAENIYTTDGTIGGPRQVHLAGSPITFDGISAGAAFNVKTPGVILLSSPTNSIIGTNGVFIWSAADASIDSPKIKLITAGVKAGAVPTNYVARLVNLDGTVEFGPDVDTVGLTNNLYLGDGTLTSPRVVTLASNTLKFAGGSGGDVTFQGPVMMTLGANAPVFRSWRDNLGVFSQDLRATWSIQTIENAANVPPGVANPRLRLSHIRGTEAAPVTGPANEYLGFVDFESYVTESGGQTVGARIGAISRSIWSSTSTPANIYISSNPSGVTGDVGHAAALFTGDGILFARQRDGIVSPLSTPNASAAVEINSATGGFLPPRGTTTQRNAIPSPASGLHFYDTTLQAPFFYNGTAWVQVGTGTGGGGTTNTSVTTGTGFLSGGIYTITSPAPPYTVTNVYSDFFAVDMRPNNNGVGSDQVKVGSGPAKPVKNANLSAVAPYDISSNSVARLVFNATMDSWILANPASTLAFDSTTLSQNTTNGVTTIAVVGGGGSSTNIYNSDGTLTGTRVVTMGVNPITFNGSAGATYTINTSGNFVATGGNATITANGGTASLIGTDYSLWANNHAIMRGGLSLKIRTPGQIAGTANTNQFLKLANLDGSVEYADPPATTVATNSVEASKLSFANTNSIMASHGSAGAGVETKLGPLWVIKNGMLRRDFANIMFEVNSWGLTATAGDTAAWIGTVSGAGAGVTGIAGVSGHAGINVYSTGTTTNGFAYVSYRSDAIDFEAGNKLFMFCRVRLPVASATTPGEAYRFSAGFGDTASGLTTDTDCITIGYSVDEPTTGNANTKWVLDCGAAGSHAISVSTETMTANAWYDLEIEATTTSVIWSINGVVQTPFTTSANIPSGASKFTPLIRMVSYNGGGATAKVAHVDAYNAYGVYSY